MPMMLVLVVSYMTFVYGGITCNLVLLLAVSLILMKTWLVVKGQFLEHAHHLFLTPVLM